MPKWQSIKVEESLTFRVDFRTAMCYIVVVARRIGLFDQTLLGKYNAICNSRKEVEGYANCEGWR